PCLLFDSIKGFDKGLRLVAGQLNSIKRVALTCGMPTDMATLDLVSAMRNKIKDLKPIAPREVKDGLFTENVWEEKDIDLLRFPTPRYNIHDGGRYIGTGHLTITRDPEQAGSISALTGWCFKTASRSGYIIRPDRTHPT